MLKSSNPHNRRRCGFEERERVGKKYWDDPRWKEVIKLRKEGKDLEANDLVMTIRYAWGVE